MSAWSQTIERASRGRERVLKSRIFSAVGANAYGQAVNIVVQLGTVPLLLSVWGAQTYGLWLVISAIPSYLALADFGFSSAANNVMTLATARGAYAEANRVFHSLLVLNVAISASLASIATVVVFALPDAWMPHTATIGAGEVRIVWVLQILQVALTLLCGGLMGGYQSNGRFALGFFLLSNSRLMETIGLVGGALLFTGFLGAATLMLATRAAFLVIFAVIMLRGASWLSIGFREASLADVRRLVSPALAVVAYRAAFAISLQGFTLVVGATLSLREVAVFTSVRTLTRAVIQVAITMSYAIQPELTRAYGAGNFARVRRLIRLNYLSVVALTLLSFVVMVGLGPWFIALWTHGKLVTDPVLLIGLVFVACLGSYWLSPSNLILAVNRHESYAYWLVGVSAASVAAAAPCARAFGVDGLLLPLLAAEVAMIVVVNRAFDQTFKVVYAAEKNEA